MKDEMKPSVGSGLSEHFASSSRRNLSVDVDRYQHFLDDSDLNEAQKEEFLRAVWSIVVTFVELGFEVHPLQEVCGKDEKGGFPRPKGALDAVESRKPQIETKPNKSGPPGGLEME